MHQELKHQVEIHKKLNTRINICNFLPLPPQFFVQEKKKKEKTTKTCLHRKEDSLVQACNIRANLTSGREV
jgi:hypothetical protein